MKTILYQPIFINPQAYFVFPSLYHIEKGDSFIEPANITGQLIINTLTDDPIILTVKDNNQVDFSIFAGKHIRISQYTDEGAVVLGEWLMPGESTPVYPDWFNDSLVCWYSPSKQKLTQLDVIESYAEDFTYWTLDNTGITSTPKKIVIPAGTELKYVIAFRGFNSFTAGFDIKYTGNAVITYRYNKEDGTVGTIAIDKSGIYHLPASVRAQKNFGFYCNPQTVTEEATIEQLPTSILKDFSGNGLDAYMYGFQGKLNSGVGIYQADFTTWNRNNFDVHSEYIIATNGVNGLSFYGSKANPINVEIKGYNDKVQYLRLGYNDENGAFKEINVHEDGIYTIPGSSSTQNKRLQNISVALKEDTEVIITQIPDYTNQLCYSGKEYCISYNQPILTDYTVIADRTWFENAGNRVFITKGNIWPNCAFTFEKVNVTLRSETFSYSQSTNIDDLIGKSGITYQTKQSYNGKVIGVGTSPDGDILLIGGQLKGEYIGCHSDFFLFNRTLNEDEINWLKENIYNIEI